MPFPDLAGYDSLPAGTNSRLQIPYLAEQVSSALAEVRNLRAAFDFERSRGQPTTDRTMGPYRQQRPDQNTPDKEHARRLRACTDERPPERIRLLARVQQESQVAKRGLVEKVREITVTIAFVPTTSMASGTRVPALLVPRFDNRPAIGRVRSFGTKAVQVAVGHADLPFAADDDSRLPSPSSARFRTSKALPPDLIDDRLTDRSTRKPLSICCQRCSCRGIQRRYLVAIAFERSGRVPNCETRQLAGLRKPSLRDRPPYWSILNICRWDGPNR